MRVALASIVKRLPGLRLAPADGEPRWLPSLVSRSLEELRIAHDATA
jgi:cytochrome P450